MVLSDGCQAAVVRCLCPLSGQLLDERGGTKWAIVEETRTKQRDAGAGAQSRPNHLEFEIVRLSAADCKARKRALMCIQSIANLRSKDRQSVFLGRVLLLRFEESDRLVQIVQKPLHIGPRVGIVLPTIAGPLGIGDEYQNRLLQQSRVLQLERSDGVLAVAALIFPRHPPFS